MKLTICFIKKVFPWKIELMLLVAIALVVGTTVGIMCNSSDKSGDSADMFGLRQQEVIIASSLIPNHMSMRAPDRGQIVIVIVGLDELVINSERIKGSELKQYLAKQSVDKVVRINAAIPQDLRQLVMILDALKKSGFEKIMVEGKDEPTGQPKQAEGPHAN